MRACLTVLCLLAATACDEGVGPRVPINERFTLERGTTVPVGSTDMRLTFITVTGDSRCPGDAICIQGGDAVVQLRVTDGSESRTIELHTGDASRASAVHRDTTIELVELQPYPFSSRPPIDPADYVATLVVKR